MAAMIVHRVDPVYPAMLSAAHVSGAVHLHAIIGRDGAIRELTLVDGNIILARSAMSAVQMWRYRPTISARSKACAMVPDKETDRRLLPHRTAAREGLRECY